MYRSGFLRGIKITQESAPSENSEVKQKTEGGEKAGREGESKWSDSEARWNGGSRGWGR